MEYNVVEIDYHKNFKLPEWTTRILRRGIRLPIYREKYTILRP